MARGRKPPMAIEGGKYRIVYGENRPAWEKKFATMKEVHKFVSRCMAVGDVIFTIEEVLLSGRRGLPSILGDLPQPGPKQ